MVNSSDIDFDIQPAHATIQQLGKRYAQYRKRVGMTQKAVSEHTGLSIYTISCFENGSQTGLTLTSFIKMLKAIGLASEIENILPELPESPRELYYKLHRK